MPTNKEKNKLPFDVRKMYCQSVCIYQQITYYEMGVISEIEFIEDVRKIVKKYEEVKDTSALLP
jgi:hypothetical protein